MRRLLSLSFIIGLTFMLSACGWHLREKYTVPTSMQQLSITSFDKYSELHRLLKNELILRDINIKTPNAKIANIYLANESFTTNTISQFPTARTAELQLNYKIDYQVTLPNQEIREFTVSNYRHYFDNPLSALAKSREKNKVKSELRSQAVDQIIRQLARLSKI